MLLAAAPDGRDAKREVAYLKFVVMHHTLGVQLVQLAATKAQSDLLKQHGENDRDDQAKEIRIIQGYLKEWYGIQATEGIDVEGRRTLRRLGALDGAVFDVQFSQLFAEHHEEIVSYSLGVQRTLFHDESKRLARHIGRSRAARSATWRRCSKGTRGKRTSRWTIMRCRSARSAVTRSTT